MRRLFILLFFSLFLLGGCSTKYSTLEPESGLKTAYLAPIEDLMKDLHLTMLRSFPGRNLTLIDSGSVKGYSTWTRFALDTYTQQAIFILVTGIDEQGRAVDAYAFEVSGSGSSGSGMSKNTQLYKTMKGLLDSKYPQVTAK